MTRVLLLVQLQVLELAFAVGRVRGVHRDLVRVAVFGSVLV